MNLKQKKAALSLAIMRSAANPTDEKLSELAAKLQAQFDAESLPETVVQVVVVEEEEIENAETVEEIALDVVKETVKKATAKPVVAKKK